MKLCWMRHILYHHCLTAGTNRFLGGILDADRVDLKKFIANQTYPN